MRNKVGGKTMRLSLSARSQGSEPSHRTLFSAVGITDGYLSYWNASSLLVEDQVFEVRPYFITKDGIKVYGIKTRTINVNGKTFGAESNDITFIDR